MIQRFNKNYQKQFVTENALVAATFGHLIGGLNGFPKMSKSIPESSINLDGSAEKLEQKILECDPKDEKIILQMINLVSDWDLKKINKANAAFQSKSKDWQKFKSDYFKYFISLKDAWEKTENKKYKFKVNSLFK